MRRRFRLFLWFFKAFLRKYFKVIIFGLILGTAVFFFYSYFAHLLPWPKKTIRVGLVGRYTPSDLPLSVLEKISRGLVKINLEGSPVPDLAEKWEVNDGGKVYTFHLKKGLTWQNGTPLKAGEIHYDLKDVGLTAKNDSVLEFRLKEPFSPFPTILAQPIFKKGFLGVGEYKVTSIQSTGNFIQSIKLENEDVLVFKFYPTEKAALLGFKLGEVDELRAIIDPSELTNWPGIRITREIGYDQFVAVFYNMTDPQLSTKPLRLALTYAIEKPLDKTRALCSLNPNSWAYNSEVKSYDYNLQKAKEFLEESKLKEVNLELTTTFSQLPVAEKIKDSWEELGVKTTVKVVSVFPETFQAFLASQEIPDDPDQYTLWHSTQKRTNITGYDNPRVDKLLEDARKTLNKKERLAYYLDFQRFLVEDAPAAFLFHPTVYTITR